MRVRYVVAALCLPWYLLGCGSASSPAAPTETQHVPGTLPPPTEPVVSLAGTWAGTIESENFPPQPITLTVVQAANCVDGVWRSDNGEWSGAISGAATQDAYFGQISFVRAEDRSRCGGLGSVEGPSTASSLRWTGAGFEVRGSCEKELPRGLVITLRKR
jgi:hypothetical protein